MRFERNLLEMKHPLDFGREELVDTLREAREAMIYWISTMPKEPDDKEMNLRMARLQFAFKQLDATLEQG